MTTWASNCFRRGDADARIHLFSFKAFMMGRLSGRGDRKSGAFGGVDFAAASYEGGGSAGVGAYFVSAILPLLSIERDGR